MPRGDLRPRPHQATDLHFVFWMRLGSCRARRRRILWTVAVTQYILNVIHLGNMADLDPVDGDSDAENQSALLGTYYDSNDRAADHIFDITADDANSDGLINSNDTGSPDTITYDLGAGPVVTQYDSLFNVDVTVTFPASSGEPDYNGLGGIIQTETGDLFFVMIDDGEGYGTNSFDNVPIESIQINSISAFGSQSMATVSDDQQFVPCFTTGTLLETARGLLSVERLREGDLVQTLDNGLQPVTWIGRRRVGFGHGPVDGPVCIRANALGHGYPERDLVVSPQHRVLIKSRIADRMVQSNEVLVPAVKLVGAEGVFRLPRPVAVHYHHFACQGHEVVWANGAPAETLFLGPVVRSLVNWGDQSHAPARPLINKRGTLRNLVRRHARNQVPLLTL